ncbi:MAG: alpha/beta hydrolase-fold protein [Reichenbachiella sp.]|uniref:alpha/beta hydrolase-fold protein n=3 Tax=Reichenbachiella sp. TaxID=2184521 RepID=UPI0032633921
MKAYILTLLLSVNSLHLLWSQPFLGQTKNIQSESLASDQQIQVYLPDNYEKGDKKYPVLYILDGQWFYLNGIAIQKTLRGENVLPEMIIVGVDMKSRQVHDSILNNKWDEYASFIKKELVSYVDQTYRTNQDRVLFGWENSAFLASELIIRESSPFTGAIVSNGGSMDEKMVESFNKYSNDQKPKYLFMANSDKDIYTVRYSNNFAKDLTEQNFANLTWEYRKFNEETHESLPYLSMYHGLRFYYHNYGSIVYASIDDFHQKGGIPYLREYFRQRGERFDQDTEIDNSTKNTLIWMAWKEDNFSSFDLFMKEFADVLDTKRYASAYWQNRLAQFYLKYGDVVNAITYFNRGIQKYPDPKYLAKMHAGLGEAYRSKGDRKLAVKNFKMAVSYATQNNDPKLADYESLLSKK